MSEINELWEQVLAELARQMTRETFRWLEGSYAVRPSPPPQAGGGFSLTVMVTSEIGRQWLAGRLARQVERVATAVLGQAVAVEFMVGSPHPPTPSPEVGEVANREALRVAMCPHEAAGWVKHSHYLARFWRAYLGAEAFDVWEYVRSHCKDGSLNWTPAVDFTGRELARRAACSVQRITGVWRGCHIFDKAYFEDGEILECCGQHQEAEVTTTKPTAQFPEGRPTCRHWVPGALELLEAEGLGVYRKHGDSPRSTFYSMQVWQHLPLLTPAQVGRLDSVIQIDHRQFISGLLRSQGLELSTWMQVQAYSFLAMLDQVREGLALPVPAVGVLSAVARNHIFFKCDSSANGVKGGAIGCNGTQSAGGGHDSETGFTAGGTGQTDIRRNI